MKGENEKQNKKGVLTIVTVTLLVLITIIAYFAFQAWYLNVSDNIKYKNLQKTDLNLDNVKVLEFKNIIEPSGVYQILYIKNSQNNYIIIDSVEVNNMGCYLLGNNIIEGNTISEIEVSCNLFDSYANDVSIQTNLGFIDGQFKLIS